MNYKKILASSIIVCSLLISCALVRTNYVEAAIKYGINNIHEDTIKIVHDGIEVEVSNDFAQPIYRFVKRDGEWWYVAAIDDYYAHKRTDPKRYKLVSSNQEANDILYIVSQYVNLKEELIPKAVDIYVGNDHRGYQVYVISDSIDNAPLNGNPHTSVSTKYVFNGQLVGTEEWRFGEGKDGSWYYNNDTMNARIAKYNIGARHYKVEYRSLEESILITSRNN